MALLFQRMKVFNINSVVGACTQLQPCPQRSLLHTQSHPRRAGLLLSSSYQPRSALLHPILSHPVLSSSSRLNSTIAAGTPASAAAASAISTNPDGYIPAPPSLPVLGSDPDVTPILNALGEPTLASQGLCNWTPPGAFQWFLENLHVYGDLPWWGTICLTTLVVRICMFPLVIASQKNSAKMSNHMPTIQRLQNKFSDKRVAGDMFGAARVQAELSDYMKKNKVSPMKSYMMPLVQMPIFISVFVGLRAMATLPIESMTMGGLFWFVDLTIPDPYYILPVVTSATMLATIEVGSDGMKAQSMSPGIKLMLRVMPIAFMPFMCSFPAAMLCYWMTSNTFSLLQVSFLRIPAVREYFQIPVAVDHSKADKRIQKSDKKKGVVQGFKEFYSNSKMMGEMESRRQADARMFEAAGKAPRQQTYKTNPKAISSQSVEKQRSKSAL